MKIRVFATAVATLLAGGGFAAAQDQPGHTPPAPNSESNAWGATKDTIGHGVGMMSAEMATSTKAFVPAAAMSDMYEVASARLAVQRSQNDDIRNFARHMVHDHTKSTEMLKATLARADLDIPAPEHFDDRHQGMIDDLKAAHDRDFDRRYIDQQVGAHEEARVLLNGYAKNGDNPELRRFASKVLPTVNMHLAMARTIENRVRVANR